MKFGEKPRGNRERFTAKMSVEYSLSQRNITTEHLNVAPVTVVSWFPNVIGTLAQRTGAVQSENWFYGSRYPLYTAVIGGYKVSFAMLPVGAPVTVMMMEEMIACGVKSFMGIGYAGGLQRDTTVGSFIIPTSCIVEEGTSSHYMHSGVAVCPSPHLVEILKESCREQEVQVFSGKHWTTDAPYRELLSKIEAYRQHGVLGVDMETSAMYVLGWHRTVDVCNLLIVSDELFHEWRPAFGTPELNLANDEAVDVILGALETGLPVIMS